MTELEELRAELARIRRDNTIGLILSWLAVGFGILSLILRWCS